MQKNEYSKSIPIQYKAVLLFLQEETGLALIGFNDSEALKDISKKLPYDYDSTGLFK
jgi:hypothetical protein